MTTLQRRPPVVAAAHDLLATARHDLAAAMVTTVATERYAAAHLAALRAAAALLAARARPAARPARPRRTPGSLLAEVAPELAEWAAFFAAGAGKRAAAEAGSVPGGHRARGRRPGPRRRPVPRPGRDRRSGWPTSRSCLSWPTGPADRHRDRATRSHAATDCPATPSSTSTSRPATPCATAPPTRTCWSSGPPSTEMDTLALTDRDGIYGAVKFARACPLGRGPAGARRRPRGRAHRAALPAVEVHRVAAGRPRRGGRAAATRPRAARRSTRGTPRVTLLARDEAGWAALCRLVSATHLAGERGDPVSTLDLVAEHVRAATAPVAACWCCSARAPSSGRARDRCAATTSPAPCSRRWREVGRPAPTSSSRWSPTGCPGPAPGPGTPARRPDGRRSPAAPGSARCSPTPSATPTAATPRPSTSSTPPAGWSPSTGGTSTAVNAEGFLKSGKQMPRSPRRSPGSPGWATEREARRLLARTRRWPTGAPLDPRADLGLGEVHFPEFEVLGASGDRAGRGDPVRTADGAAAGALRGRGSAGRYGRAPRQRIWKRLDDELEMIAALGYASYFLTVADVADLIREMGVRVRGPRLGRRQPGQLPARHLRRRPDPARPADGAVPLAAARGAARHRRRRRVGPARPRSTSAILDRFGGERCVCVSMMDTYRVRHAVRDVGAALGMPPGEIDAIAKAFPHIRARDARMALRELPELRASRARRRAGSTCCSGSSSGSTGCRATSRVHPCGVLLSDATLLDRTPVEASFAGLPDEPVRQGRRRGPRPAQARRARHPDAVRDGPRGRPRSGGSTASRSTSTTRRRCRSTTRRPSR